MPKKSSKLSRELAAEYGGFNDVQSFRAETDLTPADISDAKILEVIAADAQEQAKAANREKQRLLDEKRQLEQKVREADQLKTNKALLESELAAEKNKRMLYENLASPYKFTIGNPNAYAEYLAKERLKKEVKDELEEEKKLKRALRSMKPRPRAKSKPRSRSRSKSKKPKNKKKK